MAIVTGDKDFFQLVGGAIRVYNPQDDGAWFDADGVKEKFGVPPEQVVDVLALMGDTIDNVKGVPGIGEKGARDLIATYGSLDALLERAAEVKAKKQREALARPRRRRAASRELVTHPTPTCRSRSTPRRSASAAPSRERCYALFSELGFRSLVHRVRADGRNGREGLRRGRDARRRRARWPTEIRGARPRRPCASLADGDAGMRADAGRPGRVAPAPAQARFLPVRRGHAA